MRGLPALRGCRDGQARADGAAKARRSRTPPAATAPAAACSPTHQPAQAQPLLRPEPAPVIAPFELIANPRRFVAVLEAGTAEQHVPDRKQDGEVVAPQR